MTVQQFVTWGHLCLSVVTILALFVALTAQSACSKDLCEVWTRATELATDTHDWLSARLDEAKSVSVSVCLLQGRTSDACIEASATVGKWAHELEVAKFDLDQAAGLCALYCGEKNGVQGGTVTLEKSSRVVEPIELTPAEMRDLRKRIRDRNPERLK